MKKILAVMLGLVLATTVSFAAEQNKATKSPASSMMQTAQGTVESVQLADPAKKVKGSLGLKLDSGTTEKFGLSSSVAVYDANHHRAAATELKSGAKVKVQYVIMGGSSEAQIVTLL